MERIVRLLIIVVACNLAFQSGKCFQWCKQLDPPQDGGYWIEKSKKCRCFSDHEPWELDALPLFSVYTKKSE